MSVEQLKDFDNFFYYGSGDLGMEIESDIHQVVNQNSRSLYYNRSNDSAGLDEYENMPNTIILSVLIPYSIVSALSRRNTYVGNGQDKTKDRRIILSQNSIKIKNKETDVDISVFYIPLSNISNTQKTVVKFSIL